MKANNWYVKVFGIVLLALLCASPAGAENRALIVGVGEYAIPSANLPGIDNDVRLMRDVATMLGYEPEQIMVLLDDKATLANVEKTIKDWLVKGVTADDQVLFYFSGHGSQVVDDSNDEADGADEVLVTHDVAIQKNTLVNVYRDDAFGALLASIPTKRVYVFTDACHSGTVTRGLTGESYPKFFTYPGMPHGRSRGFAKAALASKGTPVSHVALSAAQDDQQAQASKEGSYFTLGLHRAVEQATKSGRKIDMRSLLAETTRYIDDNLDNPSIKYRPALSGDNRMMSANLFIDKSAPAAAPIEQGWFDKLKALADKAAYKVRVQANKHRFKIGDDLVVTCTVQRDGYLNIVSISPGDSAPTVLFPNSFHPDNAVKGGQKVSIPAESDTFAIKASPPVGKTLVVAFHTDHPVNFHTDGYGTGFFRTMSVLSTRGFQVVAQAPAPAAPRPEPQPQEPQPQKPEQEVYGAGWFTANIR